MRAVVLIDETLYDVEDPHFKKGPPKREVEAEFFVCESLRTLGHEVTVVPATPDVIATIQNIQAARPDFVFNLVEEIGGHRAHDTVFVQILEVLNIPYTGASPETLTLTRNKHLSKLMVAEAGVEVPKGIIVHDAKTASLRDVPLPAIVKPLGLDASEGVSARSYVSSAGALQSRVSEFLREFGGPLICEEYVPGREIIVTVSGANENVTVDSICELAFPETSRIKFATARAKFDAKYRESVGIYYRTPTQLDPPIETRVVRAARTAYEALRINAYAKVEFRVDGDRIVFIEANANSQMSRRAKSTDFASIGYDKFVDKIVKLALARG